MPRRATVFLTGLLLLAGCGSQAELLPPQPDAPVAPRWQKTGKAARPAAGPAVRPTSLRRELPPRLATSVRREIEVRRPVSPPPEDKPAYGLALEFVIETPEMPEELTSPTPMEVVPAEGAATGTAPPGLLPTLFAPPAATTEEGQP